MPLSAVSTFLIAKLKRESFFDSYLFDSLRALLSLKPGEYYPEFPSWRDFSAPLSSSSIHHHSHTKPASFDDIVDRIISLL